MTPLATAVATRISPPFAGVKIIGCRLSGWQLFYTFAHRLEKQADKHSQHLIFDKFNHYADDRFF